MKDAQIAVTEMDLPGGLEHARDLVMNPLAAEPTDGQAQGVWCGHADSGCVGRTPVHWPTPLRLLIASPSSRPAEGRERREKQLGPVNQGQQIDVAR